MPDRLRVEVDAERGRWLSAVRRWTRSGQGMEEFCLLRGISTEEFQGWLEVFREEKLASAREGIQRKEAADPFSVRRGLSRAEYRKWLEQNGGENGACGASPHEQALEELETAKQERLYAEARKEGSSESPDSGSSRWRRVLGRRAALFALCLTLAIVLPQAWSLSSTAVGETKTPTRTASVLPSQPLQWTLPVASNAAAPEPIRTPTGSRSTQPLTSGQSVVRLLERVRSGDFDKWSDISCGRLLHLQPEQLSWLDSIDPEDLEVVERQMVRVTVRLPRLPDSLLSESDPQGQFLYARIVLDQGGWKIENLRWGD